MDQQEREVIGGIFNRLRQVETQPRDTEAEQFISEQISRQPYAPYAMAQTIFAQEQALLNLNAQIEALQAQLQQAMHAQPQRSGGFLASIFGGGQPQQSARSFAGNEYAPQGINQRMQNPAYAPNNNTPSNPWGASGAQPPRQGGGFLQNAMTTAAGVAGGMVLGNVLMNAFSGSSGTEAQAANAQSAPHQEAAQDQSAAQTNDYNAAYDTAGYQDDGGFGLDDVGGDWV